MFIRDKVGEKMRKTDTGKELDVLENNKLENKIDENKIKNNESKVISKENKIKDNGDKLNKSAAPWLKIRYNSKNLEYVEKMMNSLSLNTVCKSANCPNMGECYKKRTTTFMIMGSNCTRNCRFCNVYSGKPTPLDPEEPLKVAEATKKLGLKHVVVTSVTRDDLEDYGADHFRKCIVEIRKLNPDTTIEVLIPDMMGDKRALDAIIDASPDVINHNLETISKFYSKVRPEADYERSLFVLDYVKRKDPKIMTKTGIMVGLGESYEEVLSLMDDAIEVDCDIFTIGQYLRPSSRHIEIKEYIRPEVFEMYREDGIKKGFKFVFSGPLVRSSYMAGDIFSREVSKNDSNRPKEI